MVARWWSTPLPLRPFLALLVVWIGICLLLAARPAGATEPEPTTTTTVVESTTSTTSSTVPESTTTVAPSSTTSSVLTECETEPVACEVRALRAESSLSWTLLLVGVGALVGLTLWMPNGHD